MIQLKRTNPSNQDFIQLIALLDKELKVTDGDMHSFYNQYNGIQNIKYVVVAYKNETAVACGAIKRYDDKTMEIKRVFVHSDYRRQGISKLLLAELEDWAKNLNINRCILETGNLQVEAIGLYSKNGYQKIPNFGQYENLDGSLCFEKIW
ncbi:MAG: putative acetyltransferase [Cognaticolwellia sp.]|jgi:GNAT superfamily N-acetyltransferase|tara:strand:+ start:106 stop:555 length:450 start_codon:yes stop_codon:yes gene_type:complete